MTTKTTIGTGTTGPGGSEKAVNPVVDQEATGAIVLDQGKEKGKARNGGGLGLGGRRRRDQGQGFRRELRLRPGRFRG